MYRSVFADPKTDFVFQRIFGVEEHTSLLMALLNALLRLDGLHRIVEVALLPPEQRPRVRELKYTIVDVRCTDARGTRYVVEMQVLYVEAFEKRVVYNVAKAYVNQLAAGRPYPELNDVIGISICNFELWPGDEGKSSVPMLSRWRMREQESHATGLDQLQLVFLELPKLDITRPPETIVEKWAYFFREAQNLDVVPPPLAMELPLASAFEVARLSSFTRAEWDDYTAQLVAIQDEIGVETGALRRGHAQGRTEGLNQGRKEGREEGRTEGRREGLLAGIESVCDLLGLPIDGARRGQVEAMDDEELNGLLLHLRKYRGWPE